MKRKLEDELKIVNKMIDIYCYGNHEDNDTCESCSKLKIYVHNRMEECPYKNHKPACNKCHIHCYDTKEREEIRQVMRYSGPRILFRNPVMVIKHILCKK